MMIDALQTNCMDLQGCFLDILLTSGFTEIGGVDCRFGGYYVFETFSLPD
jgi:hypothetical protein